MKTFKPVSAKLLLFGEHSVLLGSPAVNVPLWDFSARLKFPGKDINLKQKTSNLQLEKFFQYTRDNQEWFGGYIDLETFGEAVKGGLYLDSNIPESYGLGSSASVCVAVYKAFCRSLIDNPDALKNFYSKLESFFHGKSSGIDPLAIHTDRIVIADRNAIWFSDEKKSLLDSQTQAYLLDSGISRNAPAMISTFQAEYGSTDFKEKFHAQYFPLLEKLKNRIISNQIIEWDILKEISHLQLEFFQKLIPTAIYSLWVDLLQTNKSCMKLLGAGGGGFFLVFSREEMENVYGFHLTPISL